MNKIKTIIFIALISLGLGIGTNAAVNNVKKPAKAPVVVEKKMTPATKAVVNKTINKVTVPELIYENTRPLDIVANPTKYLNKRVRIVAKFDKFSTLGLDYKPAYRSSEKYITFLIKRDDVVNHIVPLSELKNFLARDIAEKYIDLKPGDDVEYSGIVFSNALGDAWLSVEKFAVLNQKAKEQNPVKK